METCENGAAPADSICLFFHRSAVVMVDGEVVTCANMFAESVGHLDRSANFLDIWNGERLRSLRSSFGTEQEWDQCRTCWFREIRYRSQRQAWALREAHRLENPSNYQPQSWDFRRYREVGDAGKSSG